MRNAKIGSSYRYDRKTLQIENILHLRTNLGYTPNDINSMLSRSLDILLICHHRKPCIDDIFFYSTIAEPLYCTKYVIYTGFTMMAYEKYI